MNDTERNKYTVMIVDDTPQNLTVLGELLNGQYRVRAVNSGSRAVKAVHTEPRPDIILLDIMMPVMDGYQVMDVLQQDDAVKQIPVIFITAMDTAADEEKGLSLGAVDYITKPFNPAIVLARVKTHIELKKARDRLTEENAWLDAEVARRMRENQLIQDLNIRALASLAELRDMETGHHILRTQLYVELLANHLREHPNFQTALDGPRLNMVVKAAPLHDIGKVGIPDAILLKPGKLTPDEFEIMKTHAQIGADAINRAMSEAMTIADDMVVEESPNAFALLQVAWEIAGSHHEKWDGSGYPAGLRAEEIPVAGRLMALADVFDALSCRRVYKKPFPFEEVARIIAEGSGKHFDPDVVDAFLALREQFEQTALQYADPQDHVATAG